MDNPNGHHPNGGECYGSRMTAAGARFNIHVWNTEPIINFPTPTNGTGKKGQLIMIPPSNDHLEENNELYASWR